MNQNPLDFLPHGVPPMNVLLIEGHPGAGDAARSELEAAGHHVHRCFDGADGEFACVGLKGSADCPLDERVDVALLVRGAATEPTSSESGLRCAVRANVPPLVALLTARRLYSRSVIRPTTCITRTRGKALGSLVAPFDRTKL